MRRRLKTTKKEKIALSKTKPVKTPKKVSKKAPPKTEEIIPKRKGLSVRVIGQTKKPSVKTSEPIAAPESGEMIAAELARKKEESAEKIKPAYLRAAAPSTPLEKSVKDLEKQKRVIMWTGITFCMILIAFFWLSNTRRVVEESRQNMAEKSKSSETWDRAVEELSNKISEMENSVDSINSFGKITVPNQASSTTTLPNLVLPTASSSATSSIPVLNKEEFEKIDQKIKPEVKQKIRFIY